MKYEVKYTSRFKKDFKSLQKSDADIQRFKKVVELLANGIALPEELHDHKLIGNYIGVRECHIRPDWLLIYKVYEDVLVLQLMRTGSHSKLL